MTVAVVTGASRGAGRGIAVALGSHGATVYVTGRSEKPGDAPLGGTIHATAAAITAAGGQGIAVRCDHADDADVAALFAQVEREQCRLDILVNNACALHDQLTAPGQFWEKPLAVADMLTVGLRSAYVASWHAAPLMVRARSGLIAFTSASGAAHYVYGPAYGAHKAGLDKFAADMAVDLRDFGVAAVSIWMGALLTERLQGVIAADPDKFRHLDGQLETPEFSGHVLWGVLNDPERMALSGRTLIGAEAALRYGLSDAEGRKPPSCRDRHGIAPREQHPMIIR